MEETRQHAAALGAFMARRRADLRISQRQAAKLATLSDTTWRLLERGEPADYRDETLTKIADALQTQPEEVFALVGRRWNGTPSAVPTLAEILSRLEAVEAALAEQAGRAGPRQDGRPNHGG